MSDSIKMVDVENYLMHYGKKGMKWGVRNELPASSGGNRKVTAVAPEKKPFFPGSTVKKELAYGVAVAGATAVAATLAGPIGAIPVAAIGRTLNSQRMLNDRIRVGSDKGVTSLKLSRNLAIPGAAFIMAKNGRALVESYADTPLGQLVSNVLKLPNVSPEDLRGNFNNSSDPPSKGGGVRFNPKAQLDNSRVLQDHEGRVRGIPGLNLNLQRGLKVDKL